MEGLQDDTGDGSMLCTEHSFKNNTPAGGICAFCLQEKLGKLVTSSFPITVFPSSSSSSPSFRSDITTSNITTSATMCSNIVPPSLLASSNTNINSNNTSNECHYQPYYSSNRSRILYLLSQKKKKKKDLDKNLVFKRSKSTATPRHYMDSENGDNLNSPNKRGFWSFRYLQKPFNSSSSLSKKTLRDISSNTLSASSVSSFQQRSRETVVVEENDSPCQSSFDRKVSRSRSVGCGSRSFSGDFFERISTGFGDCTLRRVESQREGKSKVSGMRTAGGQERVRCGGLFSGFMITSSSSSSSSSSYWVSSSSSNPNDVSSNGKVTSSVQHTRNKSWGWALASPMRAFSKPSSSSSSSTKREQGLNNKPNLAAIPSILSVRS